MTRDEAVAKVRKLLVLAEAGRGATREEAEAAASRAAELMAKFQLEQATVLDGEAAQPLPIEVQRTPDTEWVPRFDTWRGILMGGVNVACSCRSFIDRVQRNARPAEGLPGFDGFAPTFVGTGPNVAAACYLYASLCRQVDRLAGLYAGKGRAWLNSYRLGVATGVASRLREAAVRTRQDARGEAARGAVGVGTALMRLDRESQELALFYDELSDHLKLRSRGDRSGPSSGDGYHRGKADSAGVAIGGGASIGSGARGIGSGSRQLGGRS